jgi:hypothetical protein
MDISPSIPYLRLLFPPHDYRRIPTFVAGILQTTRDVSVIFFQACWNIKGKDFRAGLHPGAFVSLT